LTANTNSYVDFFRAVDVDNAGKVKELSARGFDPNTLSESGQVALYLAVQEDGPNVAEVLLTSPALKIDAANALGETALMMAALNGRLDSAKKLLDRGAQVHKPGWSPVHYAAGGPSTELLALLLNRGADMNDECPSPQWQHAFDDGGTLWHGRQRQAVLQPWRRQEAAERSQPIGRRSGAKHRPRLPVAISGLRASAAAALSGIFRQPAWSLTDWEPNAGLARVFSIAMSAEVIPMTQPYHAAANPFALLMDPQAVFRAIEKSERLERLHSRICRPLDKPLLPVVVTEDEEVSTCMDELIDLPGEEI
jgi:hypothetical protein